MMFPSITTPEGRRYWAFLVILGGCFIFTTFAAIGVYIVRGDLKLSFYLALAAHAQLFVGMSTFGFVLGRRLKGKVGKDGVEFDDSGREMEVTTKTEVKTKAIAPSVDDERG